MPSPPQFESLSALLQDFPVAEPAIFSRKLSQIEELGFKSTAESSFFCKTWSDYCDALTQGLQNSNLLHPLASIFQFTANKDEQAILVEKGLPPLRQLFQDQCHLHHPEITDDWLFLVKILILLDEPQSAGQIVGDLVQSGFAGESFVWGVIFDIALQRSSWSQFFWDRFCGNPPDLFCGVCYLDFSNQLANEQEKSPHPFSNRLGIERLREWLSSDDPGDETYAMSAADALPFLKGPEREELLEIAIKHDSEEVQLIAAEVLLTSNAERGIGLLKDLCLNPATSRRAEALLVETGQADAIPAEIKQSEFLALVEFCDWLRDPENFGEVADEIDCIGRMRLPWPPTGDEREFYLFKYLFYSDCQGDDRPDEAGVGVVGSRTVSLVGFTNPSMNLRDILAMHCCWELQQLADPRAPAIISIEEGERLLSEQPPK